MSWHFSQALEAVFSGENSSGGEPSVPSNGMPTHGTFWSPDKTTDASKPSRSGMTFRHSTESHGEAVLMWCLAASRVRTSPPRERAPESKASEAACGSTWRESSVKYCRNSSSWKTHQCLWEEVLPSSSLTLPKWGMMRDGECWELSTPVLPTNETESGSLPTPRATDGDKGTRTAQGAAKEWARGRNKDLGMIVAIWPTPQAHKTTRSGEVVNADGTPWNGITKPHSKTSGRPITTALADAVAMWPTPTAQDAKNNGAPSQMMRNTKPLNAEVGGALNPTWVEWLMGWPLGWTDCAASATAKFRQWLNLHGEN